MKKISISNNFLRLVLIVIVPLIVIAFPAVRSLSLDPRDELSFLKTEILRTTYKNDADRVAMNKKDATAEQGETVYVRISVSEASVSRANVTVSEQISNIDGAPKNILYCVGSGSTPCPAGSRQRLASGRDYTYTAGASNSGTLDLRPPTADNTINEGIIYFDYEYTASK